MKPKDVFLLVLLAAIWGGSFIFMRYLSPLLGPFALATLRTLLSGVVLTAAFKAGGANLGWKANWRHYVLMGILNTALPWLFFAYAALKLPGGVSSVVNALTPLWGAVFSAIILGDRLTFKKLVGIVLGLAGVALMSLWGRELSDLAAGGLALGACFLATLLYGFCGAYIKRWAGAAPGRSMTASSLLAAGLFLLPSAFIFPPQAPVPLLAWGIAAIFSLLCSGLAYLIYFRLIASAGVTATLSVTLMIPVFAFLWGFLFLGEPVAPSSLAGAALVLSGTGLIVGVKPLPKKE